MAAACYPMMFLARLQVVGRVEERGATVAMSMHRGSSAQIGTHCKFLELVSLNGQGTPPIYNGYRSKE